MFLFHSSFFRKVSFVSFTARWNESTVQKRKVPTTALFFAETKHWEDMTPASFIWRIPTRVTLLTQVKHERADWNYCLTYLYCRWMWWFIGLESRESRMSNVQWSIRIQNQISAPPKWDGHFGSFAVPLSFQRNGNTLGRVWLHKCFTYANVSIISWILHSNASPRPYHTSKTGNAYKQEQRPSLRKTDVTANREERNDLRRKNLYGN